MTARLGGRFLLVAWDTADWNLVSPLLDAGALPCLAGLIERGATGRLAAPPPISSPLLWTSLATGKRADAHGILAAMEPDPDGGGIRPASSTARACKALWNILSQEGRSCQVVNWPASHPAEPIRGACVTDRFAEVAGPPGHAWPLPPGAVHPERLAGPLADLRVHPAELPASVLLPFVPKAAEVDQAIDRRLEVLAIHLAEATSVHAAATHLAEHEPADFLAVRYHGFDRLARHFLPFRPPRPEHVSEVDFALYREVMDGVYRFHDMMLERLVALAGPEATVLLVSDHGFHADHLRTTAFDPSRPETIAAGHRPQGFFVLAGPGVRRDALIHGAGLLDLAPTVLALLGLPAGEDMSGRPLREALDDDLPIPPRIPSWERVEGPDGRHPPGLRERAEADAELIGRLAALGYAEQTEQDRRDRDRVAREQALNLAFVHLAAGRYEDAAPLFEEAVRLAPEDPIPALYLAFCRLTQGRPELCRELVEDVVARGRDLPAAALMRGHLALAEGRTEEALADLLLAETNRGQRPGLEALIGLAYARLGRAGDAERALRAAAALDEQQAPARLGLALALLAQGRAAEAAEAARDAVAIEFHSALAHRTLGLALAALGDADRAIQSFETCLNLDPDDAEARRRLEVLRGAAAGGVS